MLMASAVNVVDITLMPAIAGDEHVEVVWLPREDRAEEQRGTAAAAGS